MMKVVNVNQVYIGHKPEHIKEFAHILDELQLELYNNHGEIFIMKQEKILKNEDQIEFYKNLADYLLINYECLFTLGEINE